VSSTYQAYGSVRVPAAVSTATVSHGHHVAVTSMPPPWDPDDGATDETTILPAREDTAATRVLAPPPVRARPPAPPSHRRGWWLWALLLLGLAAALAAALWWFSQDDEDAPSGPAFATVPWVLGLEVAGAREILLDAGFVVEALRRADDEARKGTVFGQQPEAGTRAPEGSTVRIVVSVGRGVTTAPDVVGRSQAEAVEALEAAGLQARVERVPSERALGTVVAQVPRAGTELERGSAVRLEVSGGPARIVVPDVTGSDVGEAVAELESAGLRAETGDVDSDEPRGTVVAQEPVSGVQVDPGASVRLDVSAGPRGTTVPDLAGLPEAEATTELESLGFRVRVVEEAAQQPAFVGRVLRQVPAAGREAPPGTQVTIVVGV
jgi:serine/threonine-protein kinase